MRYYIYEHQHRADGEINMASQMRSNFAAGQSYYHERISKMAVTDLYTEVNVMLVDEHQTLIEQKTVIPNAEEP